MAKAANRTNKKATPKKAPAKKPAAKKAAAPAAALNPTRSTYDQLMHAYEFFNREIWKGALPDCLISIRGHAKCYGYFAPERFANLQDGSRVHEIAMNPREIGNRTVEKTLSTLVHEQAHLWQAQFGKPTAGYHNKEWAAKMKEIGLYPSSTGEPGGKETGQKCSHYIIDGGLFSIACAKLLATGFTLSYAENPAAELTRKKKAASKTKYTCTDCEMNVWAKPGARITCTDCDVELCAVEAEG